MRLFRKSKTQGSPLDRFNKLPTPPVNLSRAVIDSGRNKKVGYQRTAYNAAVNDFSSWARQNGWTAADQRYYIRHILRVS